MTDIDLSRRPRVELHDAQGYVIYVSYPRSQETVDQLLQRADDYHATITVKLQSVRAKRPLTDKQRATHHRIFGRSTKKNEAAPPDAGGPMPKINIPLPVRPHP